ncbi:ATP-binding protein [Magnetococcus sp. PR-3]|uniref:ATP-binding protein n=1 Tax=Magnetococcus sp. PR-3 TaxID=3120355 RepID=UPI002FCE4A85
MAQRGTHIRTRIMAIFLPLAVIPLLLLALLIGWQSFDVQSQQIFLLQQEKSQRVVEAVQRFVQSQVLLLESTTRITSLMDKPSKQSIILEGLINTQQQFNALSLITPQGTVLQQIHRNQLDASSMGASSLSKESQTLLQQALTFQSPTYGPVHYASDSQEPLMQVAIPLTPWPGAKVDGVLLADLRFRKVWNLIADLHTAPGESLFLVDDTQHVVAHRNPSFALKQLRFATPPQPGFHNGLHNKPVILSHQTLTLGSRQLTVVVQQEVWQAFALFRQMLLAVGLILLLTFIATTLAITASVGTIVRPIQQLAQTVQTFRFGHLSERADINAEDEVGQLASGFNEMANQVEQTLAAQRRSEERFSLAMKGASDGLWDWNVRTGEVYYSPRWSAMLGYLPADIDPTPDAFYDMLHPEDKESTQANIDHVFQGGEQFEVEVRLRGKDGTYRYILSRGLPVRDLSGQVIRMVGTHVDVTEIRQTQEALAQAKLRAEQASEAKSAFLATMSHEIRTPMNAILGMGDLLRDSELNSHQRRHLEALVGASETLLGLLDDILDFAKLEAGQLDILPERLELLPFLENVINLMKPVTAQKGIGLTLQTHPSTPTHMVVDPTRLRQILLNLLGNAIKFTETGGVQLSISPQLNSQGHGCLEFNVSDSGIGIDQDKLEHIFETFYQADATLTRRFGGSGLGLAIVQQLVKRMHGELWAESQIKRGSQFHVLLPLASSRHTPPPSVKKQSSKPSTPAATLSKPLRILVAEDSEENQMVVRSFLSNMPYEITIVENGLEALNAVKQDNFDLVLMDLQMPVMDGYTATAQIRQWELSQGQPKAPILALTAHALDKDREASHAAGCNAHLTKPIRKLDLLAAITEHTVIQS